MSGADVDNVSVAGIVRAYLRNRPYILEAIEMDIANFSKLTRKIQEEVGIDSKHAVKAALRRFGEKLQKDAQKREEKIKGILEGSKIVLETDVKAVVTEKRLKVDPMIVCMGFNNTNVYVVDSTAEVSEKDALRVHHNCGVVIIKSSDLVEKSPGVVAYLTSVIAKQNINLIEFASCYKYTIMVVAKKDVTRTLRILDPIIGSQESTEQ